MRTSRLIVPLAVTASLATAGTASAAPRPHAQLKGGDAPPIIPSLVQTRVARTERALDRLSQYVDDQDSARVVKVSKVIRRQTTAAWRGAKYILRTAPPPVVDDRTARSRRLHGGAVGPVIADPVTTAIAVFGLTHEVSATAIELTDGAHGDTLAGLSRTMFWTLDKRNAMVADAEQLQPAGPPPEDRSPRRALRQEEGAPDFATLMPGVTQQLDDEQQHIAGLLSDASDLRPRGRTILEKAATAIAGTETKINTIWPPVPAED